MRKALALLAASTLASTIGCAEDRGVSTTSNFQRNPQQYSSPDNNKDHELRQVTNNDTRYNLEGIIVHGIAYYDKINEFQQENEAPFYLEPRDENTVIKFDSTSETVRTRHPVMYIPRIVTNDNGSQKTTFEFNQEGPYGVRAQITQLDTENIATGIFKETQKDARYNIKSIKIGKDEYYVPSVEDAERTKPGLNFYLLRKEGEPQISGNGTITVITSHAYRPMPIGTREYMLRELNRVLKEDKTGEVIQSK